MSRCKHLTHIFNLMLNISLFYFICKKKTLCKIKSNQIPFPPTSSLQAHTNQLQQHRNSSAPSSHKHVYFQTLLLTWAEKKEGAVSQAHGRQTHPFKYVDKLWDSSESHTVGNCFNPLPVRRWRPSAARRKSIIDAVWVRRKAPHIAEDPLFIGDCVCCIEKCVFS